MINRLTNSAPRWMGMVIAFGLTALAMIYLSYSLPRLLPGDFVTAMYSSSQVTLTAEQEAELRAYYTEETGFGRYLVRLAGLDWGYSYAFLTPVSTLFFSALPWTLLLLCTANIVSMFIGFVAGVETAWRRNSRLERGMVGYSPRFIRTTSRVVSSRRGKHRLC
jgi:peptide/nickel transport system permease protein